MGRVEGKVAIVTGAARGLGKAIALRLAEEGASVVLGDIKGDGVEQTSAEITDAGGEATTVVGDLTEEEPVKELIGRAIDRFGQIDILVNDVGGGRNQKIWEMDVDRWDAIIRLNLRGTFLCTRYAAPHMMERRQGRIICLSSGSREGTPWTAADTGGSAYSAAKAGVHGFIRDVALELADYDITVNAVAPGPIDTEVAGPYLRELDERVDLGPIRLTPMGRLGEPGEVANAVLFLASDEASYISGHTLTINGGR
ncbi:MAG: SDR family NAD(P)-dependent oxidoreductase [Acidimicrobiales bacterium]